MTVCMITRIYKSVNGTWWAMNYKNLREILRSPFRSWPNSNLVILCNTAGYNSILQRANNSLGIKRADWQSSIAEALPHGAVKITALDRALAQKTRLKIYNYNCRRSNFIWSSPLQQNTMRHTTYLDSGEAEITLCFV